MRGYSWERKASVLAPWEIEALRGNGKLSGPHVLRNIAVSSINQVLLETVAERIEELEADNRRQALALEVAMKYLEPHGDVPRSMAPDWFVSIAMIMSGLGNDECEKCLELELDVVFEPIEPCDCQKFTVTFGD